ncbi:TatD family hydrolase [Flavobacterium algicola]|uniref:TatD family hydrolase n=1 Tax=Flavobacterium algicola TaxID=556529 RepID=UPI001EFDC0ED|nr:TatD family hydrolase [Flavobacterium algicola]MCG9793427.1 TatD family hydrolase [Flavobacterium algicola]
MLFFNLHTHSFTNQSTVIELVNQYPWEFNEILPVYSIGIHPWYINEQRLTADLAFIKIKLQDTNCLALGECGLDKKIDIAMPIQEDVFEKQLLLAQEYNKPVVLHCVAAYDELIAIKNRLKITVPIIIHGFSKSEQLAKQLINNDFYLSFGKHLLRNPGLEKVFLSVPNDRIFLETDTSTENIQEVYAMAAKYYSCTIEEMQQLTSNNFELVFKTSLSRI